MLHHCNIDEPAVECDYTRIMIEKPEAVHVKKKSGNGKLIILLC